MPKSLPVARETLFVVVWKYRSFDPSPLYRFASSDACSRSWLDVTRASTQQIFWSPTYRQYGEVVAAWTLDTAKTLEPFTNLPVILAQRPCQSSLYCFNFNICVAVANTLTQPYSWMLKSLSLSRQPFLAVALKYWLFALSPLWYDVAHDACNRSLLDVTWASRQQIYMQSYLLTVWRGCCCIVTWYRW